MIKTELIINYLNKEKLSKTAFCKKCKISYSTLNKILNNEENYNLIALFKIAKILNIRICEIFNK